VRNFVTGGEGISHMAVAAGMPESGIFRSQPLGAAKIFRKIRK